MEHERPPHSPRQPEQPSPFEPIPLSPEQTRHLSIMRSIAQAVTAQHGDRFILKGGTALLLGHNLPRFSTDLDFDGRSPHTDLTAAIQTGTENAELSLGLLQTSKDTPTVRRHVLHYREDRRRPLKIEVSYRNADRIDATDIITLDGICTYRLDRLATLKIRALTNRTKARDIFDTSFLLHHYPEAISDTDLLIIDQLIANLGPDHLEAILNDDDILTSFDTSHIILSLLENTQQLRHARGV